MAKFDHFDNFVHDSRYIVYLNCKYYLAVPGGLALGSLPLLLQSKYHATYTQLGIFSLAHYPYSLKLLWSPFVDSWFSKSLGRRKSWIVPIQIGSGCIMLVMAQYSELLLRDIYYLTGAMFVLVLFMATQDIVITM